MLDLVTVVQSYYRQHGRDLPWRQADDTGHFDPYKILVSEIMLQQTQVQRVIPKYQEFLAVFPIVHDLAEASLGDVLRLWSGLGYNRRAKFLWQAAQMIVSEYDGQFDNQFGLQSGRQAAGQFNHQVSELQKELTILPGVGWNTAGAICAYAYDMPVVFIETNVRSVFIHHAFPQHSDVTDNQLMPLVEAAVQAVVDREESPREWYWALMDYGSHLKATTGNAARRSKHYAKQTPFEGSRRQLRGAILGLLQDKSRTRQQLGKELADQRVFDVIDDLEHEGLIVCSGDRCMLG